MNDKEYYPINNIKYYFIIFILFISQKKVTSSQCLYGFPKIEI